MERHPQNNEERSIGALFSELAHETSTLVRKEVELAKTEMTAKATTALKNIARIAAGAVTALLGAIALLAALVVVLDHVLPLWASTLIVGLFVTGVGATLLFAGLAALKRVDPAPRATIETLKENKQWISEQAAR